MMEMNLTLCTEDEEALKLLLGNDIEPETLGYTIEFSRSCDPVEAGLTLSRVIDQMQDHFGPEAKIKATTLRGPADPVPAFNIEVTGWQRR